MVARGAERRSAQSGGAQSECAQPNCLQMRASAHEYWPPLVGPNVHARLAEFQSESSEYIML